MHAVSQRPPKARAIAMALGDLCPAVHFKYGPPRMRFTWHLLRVSNQNNGQDILRGQVAWVQVLSLTVAV